MKTSELPTFSSGRLFGPQGIGAIFEFDDLSLSLKGTAHWPERATRSIKAPELLHAFSAVGRGRPLRALAGVEKETVEQNGEKLELVVNGLPFVRFPQWMFCIRCGLLRHLSKAECHSKELPICRAQGCEGRVSPMRLMIACGHGHLQDVPWDRISAKGEVRSCRHSSSLELEADKANPTLDAVRVVCRANDCNFQISFEEVYGAVDNGLVPCSGLQPGQETSPDCPGERGNDPERWMKVVQASDAATYFAETVSAIEVPPWAARRDTVQRRIPPSVGRLRELASEDPYGWNDRPEAQKDIRDVKKRKKLQSVEQVVAWVNDRGATDGSGVESAPAISSPHELLRYEWPALTGAHPGEWQDFNIRPVWNRRNSADPVPAEFDRWGVRSVTAVDRMRLVRVFTSYRRIDPDNGQSVWPDQGEGVSSNPWLPAEETFPEAVFIRFQEDSIARWEDELAGTALERFLNGSRDRLEKSKVRNWSCPFSRRYLLLHGMSHAILRSLATDVGYEEASLAERVYAADDASGKPMAGILIYTLGADSEGSLGGLIRMAEPDRFASILERARLALRWCARDPVCGERRFSGRDGINGAACPSCLILPETSCENGNLLLERRLFHEDRGGFFSTDRGAGL